jgi:gamma-glutamyltranspeptidase/glutathione hydrolase
VVNLIDHRMTLQEAVEAPRIWSQGQELEMEEGIAREIRDAVAARGHRVVPVRAVAEA